MNPKLNTRIRLVVDQEVLFTASVMEVQVPNCPESAEDEPSLERLVLKTALSEGVPLDWRKIAEY